MFKEASVKIPRAIGVFLIIYFGLVVPAREMPQLYRSKSAVQIKAPETPIPPVYMGGNNHEQN
ncbi:hypothetical protein HX799_09250 [Pseudomonas tolaasii]|uniref:hypothetical protein n=1 Tax=Pseudomonas tolaasii TaxID=29442 RepID=UPI0015C055F6|nr:hypothetical protein [Pseudomonas tolaasii]NWC51346.1 hypothetical protein [Pseudomonas tolaasii]